MGEINTTTQALDLLRRRHRLPTEHILTDGLIPIARRLAALEEAVEAAKDLRAALLSPNVELEVLAAGIEPLTEAAARLKKALAAIESEVG